MTTRPRALPVCAELSPHPPPFPIPYSLIPSSRHLDRLTRVGPHAVLVELLVQRGHIGAEDLIELFDQRREFLPRLLDLPQLIGGGWRRRDSRHTGKLEVPQRVEAKLSGQEFSEQK